LLRCVAWHKRVPKIDVLLVNFRWCYWRTGVPKHGCSILYYRTRHLLGFDVHQYGHYSYIQGELIMENWLLLSLHHELTPDSSFVVFAQPRK
jgi:hypothetical protein